MKVSLLLLLFLLRLISVAQQPAEKLITVAAISKRPGYPVTYTLSFRISPNPARNLVRIDYTSEKRNQLRSFDVKGRLLTQQYIPASAVPATLYLDVSAFPSAMYIFDIRNHFASHTFRVVVTR